jgi:hypothetical protein
VKNVFWGNIARRFYELIGTWVRECSGSQWRSVGVLQEREEDPETRVQDADADYEGKINLSLIITFTVPLLMSYIVLF